MPRFRAEDLPRLAVLRAPFRADLRTLFLVDFLAPLLAAFLAPFLADFFALPRALLADFREELFLALFLRGRDGRGRAAAGSSRLPKDEVLEAGAGAGVFSIGSGSIQPEPDQPISI
ncbi:MAG TPA: hypothetical protein VFS51_02465 [Gemmatimonadales bacterium]|nr:hypothetical protein [Gemmatimonadales bacterium]